MDDPTTASGVVPNSSDPPPIKTFNVYRRLAFGRKHFLQAPGSDAAEYFIVNPVPHKHAGTWKPVFYRGDNPKYDTNSKRIARARRTAMWSSFSVELGDGVHEVLENKKRIAKRKAYERKQKFRKFFGMKPKPPKEELEEVQEVTGLVMPLKMQRLGFLGRTLRWELHGQVYTWKGTRRFMRGWFKGWKGISHDFKLVDSENEVVATFEKDRWASYRGSEKTEGTANKTRTQLGTLTIFPSTSAVVAISQSNPISKMASDIPLARVDEIVAGKRKDKPSKYLNLDGSHSGELREEAIVFTCWMALEAEHRLRYKIFDLIEEVGENVSG